jgi:hypothetical protein
MTNESLGIINNFNLTNLNFSGIAQPERVSQSVLISGQNDLEKLSKDLMKGMTKKAYNQRQIIHIKQAEVMKV